MKRRRRRRSRRRSRRRRAKKEEIKGRGSILYFTGEKKKSTPKHVVTVIGEKRSTVN